jgi:hypothetical protein
MMPDSRINIHWLEAADLTIYEAAFWMLTGGDPRAHAYRCEHDTDSKYEDYFNDRGVPEQIYDKCDVVSSAIRAGLINLSGDTYHPNQEMGVHKTYILIDSWLDWCRKSEYLALVELFKFNVCSAPVVPAEAGGERKQLDKTIPGKMPNIAIGQLAIKVAWKIECETGRRATANQVIQRLQKMEPEEPVIEAVIANGVKWSLKKGGEKRYDVGACAKTLENWNKTRT